MSREWKPGDVAADINDGSRAILVGAARYMGCPNHHPGEPHWHYSQSDWNPLGVDSLRPLVVIDPEDREQVERLAVALGSQPLAQNPNRDNLQAALREFANPTPPKPDEPQGLGAVVEDADGNVWVLVYVEDDHLWARVGEVSLQRGWRAYSEIAAVKVLSPGWSE